MSDRYLRFTHMPLARKAIKTLNLPLPVPPMLKRADGPWQERPLTGSTALFGTTVGSSLTSQALATLGGCGAEVAALSGTEALSNIKRAATRGKMNLDEVTAGDQSYDALVFDASGIKKPEELRALYDFFHPTVGRVNNNGRIIVLGRPEDEAEDAAQGAASRALEGFVRSLAKERGRKGITAQLIYVGKGAESRLETPLRFLLSRHSAFVDGQVLHVGKDVQGEAPRLHSKVLTDRVALVTGAARGIGAAIARRLAAEGAKVVCLDRPGEEDALQEVASPIGGKILAVDITDATAPQQIADFLDENYGGVDVVVHNAGVTRDKTLVKMSESWWDMVININLACILPINERLLQGTLRKNGRIVCMASIAGIAGNAGQSNYGASKAGLIGYVAALGKETAKQGITANAVAPGFIETRMTAEIPLANREAGRRLSSLAQGGLPEDVAEAVTLFSSPGANGLNGTVLRVCGQSLLGA